MVNKKIGLIVNPIAGMGGSVGLKGTDDGMHRKAAELGAQPIAPTRTGSLLCHIKKSAEIDFLVAPGDMGETMARDAGLHVEVIGSVGRETTGEDTRRIAALMLDCGVDLIVFVGGDGTARNIHDAVDRKCPVIGVPSGVKVYSSVFALNPRAAAAMLDHFIEGVESSEQEVLDIDEEAFRNNILDASLYGYMLVPADTRYLQGGKEGSSQGSSNVENQNEIAEYVVESMQDDALYLLGSGTTVNAIAKELGIEKTLLGVDAVLGGNLVASDLNETGLLDLLGENGKTWIIVTPLGGNGFIFGRGNRQFTPRVIRMVGTKNVQVVATRDKMQGLQCLQVDTGDEDLDRALSGYADVIVGYKYSKVCRVEC
jgi:predicted polyphosphate/ATP-dependent NAD kinase